MPLPIGVYDAYGLQPPDAQQDLGGLSLDNGGMAPTIHPAALQALGLLPPEPAAAAVPDGQPALAPMGLPSMADHSPASPPDPYQSATPDHVVSAPVPVAQPVRAAAPQPAVAARPPTPMQQIAGAQAERRAAEQVTLGAIGEGEQAKEAQNADALAAYQQHGERVADLQKQQKDWIDEYNKVSAAKQSYIEQTRRDIDNYKVDQHRYWNSLGMGDKIGWGIAAIMNGIGNALQRQGGNQVLQLLQEQIHQSIGEQMDQREQLKERNARAEHELDRYNAFSQNKQAQFSLLEGQANQHLANALNLAAAKAATPEARAAAKLAAGQAMDMAAGKFEESGRFAANYDMQGRQVGIAAGHLALDRERLGLEKYKIDEENNLKAAALLAKQQGKLSDEESKRAIYIPDASGKLVVARKQDGTPVLAGSAEIASKDQNMVAAAAAYNRLVGQMVRGLKDHGGESDWIKGDDWQKMMTDLQSATAELHDAYGITAFREPTVQFFEKMATGGVNPTSFVRDASAALEHSNRNLQAKVNERVSARGYDGPQFGWQNTSNPPPAAKSPDQNALADALQNPHRGFDARPGKLAVELGDLSPKGPLGPNETIDTRLAAEGEVMPSVRANLQAWGGLLGSDNPEMARNARALLEQVAATSASPETKNLAQQILERYLTESISSLPGAPEMVRSPSGLPVPMERR